MEKTLEQAKAYWYFGELYRKPRPPALQQKVEEIVRNTPDVLTRIDRINDIDRQFSRETKKDKKKESRPHLSKKQIISKSSLNKKADPNPVNSNIISYASINSARKGKKLSFWSFLFNRQRSQILTWGKHTKVLTKGFFSKIKLSSSSKRIFSGFSEAEVVNTLQALRLALADIWNEVDIATYNTIVTFYKFFGEYTKFQNLFQITEEPEQWIQKTLTMQRYYAHLVLYPNYQETLLKTFPEYLRKKKELTISLSNVKNHMKQIIQLENDDPKLKNVIIGFYILNQNKLCSWDDVESSINATKPIVNDFQTTANIKVAINNKIEQLKKMYKLLKGEIQQIEDINRKYLTDAKANKFDSSFLDQAICEVVQEIHGHASVPAHIIHSYKNQPLRLLLAILKDFNTNHVSLLNHNVFINKGDKERLSVTIFNQAIFKTYIEIFHQLLRTVDSFYRKCLDLNYTFPDLIKDVHMAKAVNTTISNLHKLIRKVNDFFTVIIRNLRIVIYNHELAKHSLPKQKKLSESETQTNRNLVIVNLERKAQYLPYAEEKIFSSTRYNEKTVEFTIRDILYCLYNYLYLFQDQPLHQMLNGLDQRKKNLLTIEKELNRLQGSG